MRLTYTDIRNQHYRNINLMDSNGNPLTDPNIDADFNLHLGQRYQMALARLADYRTVNEYSFTTGMQTTLLSSGVAQTISSITSSGTTATVTTAAAHGYSSTNSVQISGASPSGYNGTYSITVLTTTTFTYTLPASVNDVAATVSQYYPLPVGEVTIEGMYITIGAVNYPLRIINTRWNWEQLNAIQIQASAIPQFYFPRVTDFGIWPTPQAVYTGNISYHYRDRNLSVADYTTGTATLTQYGTQLIGSGTTWTKAMVGRWFTVTDATVPGQGYWYQVTGYTDATHLTINQAWTQATVTTASGGYRIGESPDIPEEGHIMLADGTAADYYGGMRKDITNSTYYNNLFYTGDANNPNRKEGTSDVLGGLIGLINTYADRDNRHIIKRRPKLSPLMYKVFATTLS
jgi:hypothetical protein